jgi:hypothetical protein
MQNNTRVFQLENKSIEKNTLVVTITSIDKPNSHNDYCILSLENEKYESNKMEDPSSPNITKSFALSTTLRDLIKQETSLKIQIKHKRFLIGDSLKGSSSVSLNGLESSNYVQ